MPMSAHCMVRDVLCSLCYTLLCVLVDATMSRVCSVAVHTAGAWDVTLCNCGCALKRNPSHVGSPKKLIEAI